MAEETLSAIMESLDSMKQSFQESIDAINKRVDGLASEKASRSLSRTPSPRRKGTERPVASTETESSRTNRTSRSRKPLNWADRVDRVCDLSPLRDEDLSDGEEDMEMIDRPVTENLTLSEETFEIWSKAVASTMDNTTRRELRSKYPVPETDTTRVPKLDEIFTSSESKFQKNSEAKAVEKDLLHISACTLDVARPLLALIEGVQKKELTPEDVLSHANDTLELLGNSVAATSKIRRKRVLKVCNPDISSLADDQELYSNAPPMLFGEGFEMKIKGRAEALKILHKGQVSSSTQSHAGGKQRLYFRANRPSYPQRGGGYQSRGRTQYNSGYQTRYNPYAKNSKTEK